MVLTVVVVGLVSLPVVLGLLGLWFWACLGFGFDCYSGLVSVVVSAGLVSVVVSVVVLVLFWLRIWS